MRSVALFDGHVWLQVEVYKWTGKSLQLALPSPAACSLVTSVAIIKQQYLLVGNTRKGLAFLQAKEGELKVVSRDFGISDALAVEFLLAGPALAFLEADTRGNFRVFKYQRDEPFGYEPPGIRAVPVGAFHVGHTVRSLSGRSAPCQCRRIELRRRRCRCVMEFPAPDAGVLRERVEAVWQGRGWQSCGTAVAPAERATA